MSGLENQKCFCWLISFNFVILLTKPVTAFLITLKTTLNNWQKQFQKHNFHDKVWQQSGWALCPTFQTGERRCFVPRCLVGEGEVGQTETGAVVLVKIACEGRENHIIGYRSTYISTTEYLCPSNQSVPNVATQDRLQRLHITPKQSQRAESSLRCGYPCRNWIQRTLAATTAMP